MDILVKRACAIVSALLLLSCSMQRKIERVRSGEVGASLSLSGREMMEELHTIRQSHRDTITVMDPEGRRVTIMKAVRDDESGEMVATETLDAAVVTARFRNVAERHGMVDLQFEIRVPAQMQDSRWQLRFYPDMFILGDSLRLEPVIITGEDYRRAQLRGYQQYQRFLSTIIQDTTRFVDLRGLEIFIKRNMPELYRFKSDSSYVSDEEFRSYYGVTEAQALEHYTRMYQRRLNERRKARRGRMWAKYVKVPIVTEGIRLDTVLRTTDGDFVFHYTQTVRTRPQLRKVDIVLSGDIFEADRKLYSMSPSQPLTFYISSLSTLVDPSEHYLTRIVERRAEANTACYVDFSAGKWAIDLELGHNRSEMGRIRDNIMELLQNQTFEIDSIVIVASASPEGSVSANRALSSRRAAAVAEYFSSCIGHYRDSVLRNSFSIDLTGENLGESIPEIGFRSRSNGENWSMLSLLVDRDSLLGPDAVASYMRCLEIDDPDARERALSREPYYRYMRENLYPRLRTVRFDFFLHRKGMVKDTVHTTELDTAYMRGVQALRDRDYETALGILRPYNDFNAALAFLALDYNASAMAVLRDLPRNPAVNYALSILYARAQDDSKAVQCFLDACREDPSFVFRGNLDPEIRVLIRRYGLDEDNEDDLQ